MEAFLEIKRREGERCWLEAFPGFCLFRETSRLVRKPLIRLIAPVATFSSPFSFSFPPFFLRIDAKGTPSPLSLSGIRVVAICNSKEEEKEEKKGRRAGKERKIKEECYLVQEGLVASPMKFIICRSCSWRGR